MLVQNNFCRLHWNCFVAPIEAISAGCSGLTLLFRNQYLFIQAYGRGEALQEYNTMQGPPI